MLIMVKSLIWFVLFPNTNLNVQLIIK